MNTYCTQTANIFPSSWHETTVTSLLKLTLTRRSVVVSGELALLGHGLHERLGEVEDVALHEALHDLEQLLHDDGDALVAQQLRHAPEVSHADEARELRVWWYGLQCKSNIWSTTGD